jgi:hypothetical protein
LAERITPLKNKVMRGAMGLEGRLPKLAKGETIILLIFPKHSGKVAVNSASKSATGKAFKRCTSSGVLYQTIEP